MMDAAATISKAAVSATDGALFRANAVPHEPVRCAHCADCVPAGLIEAGEAEQFCCSGCRTARAIICGAGLERYYALRDSASDAQIVRPSERTYRILDDPAFQAVHVRCDESGIAQTTLLLENVHCAACVWLVERLPRLLPGVLEARLDIARRTVLVRYRLDAVKLSSIAEGLDRLGYPAHPFRATEAERLRQRELRRDLIDLGLAGFAAGNVMLLAFALYGGHFAWMDDGHRTLFRMTSFVLAAFAVAVPGRAFFRRAWLGLRSGHLHMDLPVAIALSIGTAWGGINSVTGQGEVYFESLTAVVFLLLSGRALQRRQQRRAQDALELLHQVMPSAVRRIRDGQEEEVAAEALAPGDLIVLRAGEAVPVDGIIEEGKGQLNRALLTGESAPRHVQAGDQVHAGTQCLTGRMRVRATAAGAETRVGRLLELVRRFSHERPRIVERADHFAHRFVAIVLFAAALTLIVWLFIRPGEAVERAITLLIVTCPCALGLATPLAMFAGIGQAAQRGMLIKGSVALDALADPGLLLLDKTGTVTLGRQSLVQMDGDDALAPLIAAIESEVDHPIARALARDLAERASAADRAGSLQKPEVICSAQLPRVSLIQPQPGMGVHAVAGDMTLRIGSPRFAETLGGSAFIPRWYPPALASLREEGLTPVAVSVQENGRASLRLLMGLGDRLHEDAREQIAELSARGWKVGMLSGDDPQVVRRVAARIGLKSEDCHGGMEPEDKAAYIRAARAADPLRPVVMVGDGINDAAAHAAAHVGIAVKGAAEVNLAAADVHLARAGLRPLVELIDGAKRVRGTIGRNFAVSLSYNALAGALAVTGIINPIIAAIIMPISSITVVTISWRRRAFIAAPLRREPAVDEVRSTAVSDRLPMEPAR